MSCYVLAGRVRYTTPELAERYGVDNRTILRDIDALRAAGALIAKDDAGRWRMTKRPDWPGVELTALDRAALEA
jgi:predicted DNA-binding transcriptional regulator YafY